MNTLIELVIFLFMLPTIGLYALFSILRSVVSFFGAWFVPGVLSLYLGVVLLFIGQPDPSLEWETIIQKLARATVGGLVLPNALMAFGGVLLTIGAVLRLKPRK